MNKSSDINYRHCTAADFLYRDILEDNLYCPLPCCRAGSSHPIPAGPNQYIFFFVIRNAAWHTPRVMSNLRRTADALRTNNYSCTAAFSVRTPARRPLHVRYRVRSKGAYGAPPVLFHPHCTVLSHYSRSWGSFNLYHLIYRYFTPVAHFFLNIYI